MTTPTHSAKCESIQELIPEYALGALPPEEADSVRSHTQVCPLCRGELGAYRLVVDGLLLSPAPATPSPILRERVLRAAGLEPAQAGRAVSGRGLRSWLASTLSPMGGFARLSPAAAALALLLASGVAYQSFQLRADLQSLQMENQALRSERASDRLLMSEALRPDATVWSLRGTESAPSARASLYCSRDSRKGLLSAADLPPLPKGQAYQLWLIRNGQRTSGGLMKVDSTGKGMLAIEAPEPFGVYQAVGMTVEPDSGSPGPTGQRVLAGQIY